MGPSPIIDRAEGALVEFSTSVPVRGSVTTAAHANFIRGATFLGSSVLIPPPFGGVFCNLCKGCGEVGYRVEAIATRVEAIAIILPPTPSTPKETRPRFTAGRAWKGSAATEVRSPVDLHGLGSTGGNTED